MICAYCKANIPDSSEICPECGRKQIILSDNEPEDIFSSSGGIYRKEDNGNKEFTSESAENPIRQESVYIPDEKPAVKKRGRVKTVIAVCLAAVCLAAILVFFLFSRSNSQNIKKQLAAGQYDSAYSLFEENFTSSGGFFLNRALSDRLEKLYEEYRNLEREYESAEKELSTIEKMEITGLKEETKSTRKELQKLHSSVSSFLKAEEYYSGKNYILAIKEYEKVIKKDLNYSTAKTKLEQSRLNYRNTVLSEAAEKAAASDYISAAALLTSALEVLPDDELIEKRLGEYKKYGETKTLEEIMDSADTLSLKGDYAAAIRVLEQASEGNRELASDETYGKKLKYYKEKYETQFLKDLNELVSSGDYIAAGELITEASEIMPYNETVEKEKAKLQGKIPEYLNTLDPVTSSDWKFSGQAEDSFGVDHSDELNHIKLSVKSKAEYELNGKYETVSLYVAAGKEIDKSVKCKLKITAAVGGEYRYRECEVNASKAAEKISFNISGCTSLSFEVTGEGADIIMYSVRLEY